MKPMTAEWTSKAEGEAMRLCQLKINAFQNLCVLCASVRNKNSILHKVTEI